MSSDNGAATTEASPTVQLFQRAHQKMTQLGRIDEQIHQLLARRRGLQEELRAVQVEINEEFDRQLRAVEEPPAKIRPTLEHVAGRGVKFAGESIEAAAGVA